MHQFETTYNGSLRTTITHLKSGSQIITDAPTDNHGKGETFSPTDLVASAFGSCILTILGISAEVHKLNLDGTKLKITKIMGDNPRKIDEIIIAFEFPDPNFTEKQKQIIRQICKTCPVGLSLNPDIKQTFIYNF